MGNKRIHLNVAEAYTEALERSRNKQGGGCCGPSSCCTPSVPDLAGYGPEAERHAETADSSFGCGNPLAFAGVRPGETVLDLGSGAGLDLLIAADKVGPEGKVIGVDMTDAMIQAARDAAARAGHHNIEIRKGLIENLPVDDGTVDWVISNCVINLSPDKSKVFSEINRVLRSGGRFSISDIVVEDLPEAIRQSAAAYAACIGGAISEREYIAGMREAGLDELQVSSRVPLDAGQILAILDSDLCSLGLEPKALETSMAEVEGKIASIEVTGTKRVR